MSDQRNDGRSFDSPERDTGEFRIFLAAERDSAELHAAARVARQAMASGGTPYRRLSDLLDEVLPAEKSAQDRIARAISLGSSELDALRRSRLDPLQVSPYPLLCLADVFGIDVHRFRMLLKADHERFVDATASARGSVADASESWQAFDEAWERLTSENPARYTSPD